VNFGHCDPNMAPAGYRTLLTWQLAEVYYKDDLGDEKLYEHLKAQCPPQHIRPHVNELLPMLHSLRLDYIFQYRSVAMQHRIQWLKLPDEIDLGSGEFADSYAKAKVEIAGKTRGEKLTKIGRPILFSITMVNEPKNPAGAEDFLRLLLGPEGQDIMKLNFQEPVVPPTSSNVDAMPENLRQMVESERP